ncbi:LuxR C-terminal-related transcriptional regulator [Cohnella pontilimi]|nr:LuxR C-terminal-related transcriptional regulator [Cohnella pontilimi]
MERSIELIQHVQDVFAQQYDLTLFILDPCGRLLTLPSRANDWTESVKDNMFQMNEWMGKIVELSVLDSHPGLKVIFSPIKVMGKIAYYIWAGVFIETGSRQLLYEYLEANDKSTFKWKSSLQEVRDRSTEEKQLLIEKIKALSDTISILLENDQKEQKNHLVIGGIIEGSGLVGKEHAFAEIIQQFMNIAHDIEFAGFAERSKEDCVVSHMFGGSAYSALVGSRFFIGEGFLGHVMATGTLGYWNNILHDPRNVFFRKANFQPLAIACIPLLKDNEVLGVLFGGTCSVPEIEPLSVNIGKIASNIIVSYLTQRELHDTLFQQNQQLYAFMEICNLITRVQDVRKIAFMMVDMSLNIMNGNFAAVTLFDLDAATQEVHLVSRGLTTDQSEKYGKLLLQEYQGHLKENNGGIDRRQFPTRTLEWGTAVEIPIYNRKLYGVLSVAYDSRKTEYSSFLSALVTIGAIAIQQSIQKQNEMGTWAASLHEALSLWDHSSYEFAQMLRDRSALFTEFLELPQQSRKHIEYACLLSPYRPDMISRILQEETELSRMILDYQHLNQDDEREVRKNGHDYSQGGQILKLVSDSLKYSDKVPHCDGIDSRLQEKFNFFMLRSQVLEQQVTIEDKESFEIEGLSKREQEVLELIVQGLNNKQIAKTLFISEHTVKNHITNIFQKLGTNDRAGLMAYYYQRRAKTD